MAAAAHKDAPVAKLAFWDAPSSADETAAWGLVQKGLAAKKMSPREKLYLNAVAALVTGNSELTRQNRRIWL